MINWHESMQQTFEFYMVDPNTWKDYARIGTITSCSINRDTSSSTRGSATINCSEALDECYVRIYLIAIQNGVKERIPLGTFLVQTPSVGFNGKVSSISMDAYTPLIELKGTPPPIGYSLLKGDPIMSTAAALCRENMRAPVIAADNDDTLKNNFVANLDDTWVTFISDLIANAKFGLGLDEMGQVIFEPEQDIASLRPVWTYTDDNSSILYPNISDERDLYNIPNVVEVIYSTNEGYMFSRVENNDTDSPVSIVNRGWTKTYRDTNPNFGGLPTQAQIDEYAVQLLRNLSCLEHKITYSHGYCPVKVGDCVILNYRKAKFNGIKAKVISQTIKCETSCKVEETAAYTTKLWR